MKYSYNWLKELTQTEKGPQVLADKLMMQGFELEELENLGKRWEGIAVGKVLSVKQHPNADRLKITKVDIGKKKLSIVCGASNVRPGLTVAVALVGSVLPKNKIKLEKREVRGEISEGMLCSADELMLGKDSAGIIELDEKLIPGQSLSDALELNDWVLDMKVLPNRAHDCLSHQGMAREILAGEGNRILEKAIKWPKKKGDKKEIQVEIQDKELCPRYIGGVFQGIKIGDSPNWLKARLIACGMEPINNVVDITNLVMLETGNPLHAFDREKVLGKKIIVRRANKGERLELLGDKFLELTEQDLLITDQEKALALAGIKGGKYSGINQETKEIILESANFNALSIRKTRQKHSLVTESQSRFEKGLSLKLTEKAFLRAKELLEKYAGAKLIDWTDEGVKKENKWGKNKVILKKELAEKLLGKRINWLKAEKILSNLGFQITSKKKNSLVVLAPYWRLDIEGQEDLVEEIGRMEGYDQIPAQTLCFSVGSSEENFSRQLEWQLRDYLIGLGFDETPSYSFYGEKDIEVGEIKSEHWILKNSLSPEQSYFRQTLLGQLFRATAVNRSYFDCFNIFELNRVYKKDQSDRAIEKIMLAGLVFNREKTGKELFYFIKGKIESLLENFSGQEPDFILSCKNSEELPGIGFLKSYQKIEIILNQESFGFLGLVSEKTKRAYGFKEDVAIFELDFEKIKKVVLGRKKIFCELDKFPSVKRDLSMFVPCKMEIKEIKKNIRLAGGNILKKIELFDVFEREEGKIKSLAFHLEFNHPEKTLESAEVEKLIQKIIARLEKTGAKIRR